MIEYDEEYMVPLLFKIEGSVYCRSALWSLPASVITLVLVLILREYPGSQTSIHRLDLENLAQSHLWAALTAVLAFMVGFRTRQGLARFWEGTGLLHQMKGEWFDTVSNCVTFTINAKSEDDLERVTGFRHTIVRLMSLCHASALEEISNMGSQMSTIDVLGLNSATLHHLKDCVDNHNFNKVEVLLHLVQSLITKAHTDGILKVPPPILSRVYQTISRGYVNLLNTKKITDTKFPFPYVQLITLLLTVHTIFTPLVVAVSIRSIFLAPMIAFIPLFGLHSMNFISQELEDPFGLDDNDLPLNDFQDEMNSCLLMLLHPNTDLIAGINSTRAVTDFYDLKNSIYPNTSFDSDAPATTMTAKFFFDPKFRIKSSTDNLEMPRDVFVDVEDDDGEHDAALQAAAEAAAAAGGEQAPQAGPKVEAPLPSVGSITEVATEGANPTPSAVPAFPEPKFTVNDTRNLGEPPGRAALQTRDLEVLLSKSMEDFNRHLTCWTQTMEEQVRELSHGFSTLNDLVNAGPPKSSRRERDPGGGAQGQVPGGARSSRSHAENILHPPDRGPDPAEPNSKKLC